MGRKKSLQQLVEERYSTDTIRQAIIEDVAKHGTEEPIVAGQLHLPTEQDALHWHRRMTNQAAVSEEEHRQKERVAELEKQVAALIDQSKAPRADYVQQLEERIRTLEGRR